MTEAEWLACADPTPMLEFLRDRASSRKLICFFLAFCPDFTSYSTDGLFGSDLDFRPPWLDVDGPDDDALPSLVRCWGWAKFVTHPLSSAKDKTRPRAVAAPLLRELIGNPFRTSPLLLPAILAWNDGTVLRLAQAIYEDRKMPEGTFDTGHLAILADALLDAGCDDENMLTHLRSPGPHVRGCWAIDLILGKS